jgi:DNA polymerase-3 subunit alpha
VFIRIAADREQPALLARLREQLKSPDGRLGVILVYEREHKTIALSDRYRVTPSPEWIRKIEAMMGEGSVRIR